MAEAFGQAATQAPQPMQAAASIASSAFIWGIGMALASGAPPVLTETSIHCFFCIFLGDWYGIGVRCTAGIDRDKAAGSYHFIQAAPVDYQILFNSESSGTEWFNDQCVAIFEVTHVKLAEGGFLFMAVGVAVNHGTAHTADALAAIMVKGNGFFTFSAWIIWSILTPDLKV
jgi:hypothetical protein